MLLSTAALIGKSQSFQWAKRAGLWAYDYGLGVGTDNSGNVYIAGKYEMNANFGGTTVPCKGNHDIFVAKYSSSGALTWVRTAGGYLGDYAHCLSVDNAAVYVGGEIEGFGTQITFVGSSIKLYGRGYNDIVIAKYDLDGNLLWAKNEGDIYNDEALGITSDSGGNVFVCGFFSTKARFGSSTIITGYGDRDIFIAKYNTDGNLLWVKKAGGIGRDEARGIKCDANGNVYICGVFKGSANFSGQVVNTHGNSDMFLAKYATNGSLQWVKTAGGSWDDIAWSVTIDNAGKIFIAGEFNASMNFGGIQLNTTGSADIFVARYNSSGNVEWAKKAGGYSIDRARGIGTDGSTIFITGQFGGTASFGSTTRISADASDVFIAALNNNGGFLWATSVGGSADTAEDLGFESGCAISAGPAGSVYATGSILNGGQFGATTLNPYSRTDIFLTKLKNGSSAMIAGTELVSTGAIWKYLDNGSNQDTAWRTLSYSDATWKTGNAEFGYGDEDETTLVSYGNDANNKFLTTYFRKTFNVINKSSISGLELSLLRDDGAVIYINGTEIYRSNMPSGNISYTTPASIATANASAYEIKTISSSSLVDGANLIAVEIHQNSSTNSDLSFNLKLRALNGGTLIDEDNTTGTEFSDLIAFTAEKTENRVNLNWKTSDEIKTEYFIIERSIDAESFIPIGRVMADTNEFIDEQLPERVQGAYLYYRINQTDYDGKATFSSTASVAIESKEELSHVIFDFYPNPAKNSFTLYVSEPNNEKYTYAIYDIAGQKVKESIITTSHTQIEINTLSAGIYLITINSGTKMVFQEKLVVQ